MLNVPRVQVFVESLDSAFENVCELDLVFHFDEVRPSTFRSLGGRLLRSSKPPRCG